MYETSNTQAAFDDAMDGAQLRTISWAELVARLSAARDLRSLLVREHASAGGTFTAFAEVRDDMLNSTKPDINPDGLVRRKQLEAIEACAANIATPGDREMQ